MVSFFGFLEPKRGAANEGYTTAILKIINHVKKVLAVLLLELVPDPDA